MDLEVVRLLSRVYAFCEEKGHAIMDYPFVHFLIRTSIIRHAKLQNVARTLMDQQHEHKLRIERHGVGKPIRTIKSTNLSIYSNQEERIRDVFTSTFCTIEDTNG
jgi:hypothetical protein